MRIVDITAANLNWTRDVNAWKRINFSVEVEGVHHRLSTTFEEGNVYFDMNREENHDTLVSLTTEQAIECRKIVVAKAALIYSNLINEILNGNEDTLYADYSEQIQILKTY